MPCLTTWAHSVPQWFCPCGQCHHQKVFQNNHMAAPHRNSPEPSETLELSGTLGTFRKLPPEPTPAHNGTVRNLPEPASGTYTSTHTGTLRNLLEPASRTYTSKHRNSPELFGTLRNLPPEPTPAHTGTLRNLPPKHRHTPELIWAEDPISLRCWWKKHVRKLHRQATPNSV